MPVILTALIVYETKEQLVSLSSCRVEFLACTSLSAYPVFSSGRMGRLIYTATLEHSER